MKLLKILDMREYGTQGRTKRYCLFECPMCLEQLERVKTEGLKSAQCKTCTNKLNAKKAITHGSTKTKLYKVWSNMKSRCNNPKATFYSNYGGRGIKVCKKWDKSFSKFEKWAKSNGYSTELVIDRIDNDGKYKPSNCRFVSVSKNNNNARHSMVLKHGIDYLSEVCECYQNTDITQEEISVLLNISSASVSNLVTGKHNYI